MIFARRRIVLKKPLIFGLVVLITLFVSCGDNKDSFDQTVLDDSNNECASNKICKKESSSYNNNIYDEENKIESCVSDEECQEGYICKDGNCINNKSESSDIPKQILNPSFVGKPILINNLIGSFNLVGSETKKIALGSVIENKRIKFVVADITANENQSSGYVGLSVRNPDNSPHPLSPKYLSFSYKYGVTPYLSTGGLYLKLNSINLAKKEASLEIFYNASAFVKACEDDPQMQNNNFNCRGFIEYEKTIGDEYLKAGNIIGFAVPAYKDWLPYGTKTLSVCHKKISEYLGITPWKETIYYSIIPAVTSGGLGADVDVITQEVPNNPYIPSMPDQIDYCPNEWAQNHEMTHIFLAGTPMGIGYCNSTGGKNAVCLALNEGLAQYIRYVPEVTDEPAELECGDKGYTIKGDFNDYYNFTDSLPDDEGIVEYITGACIWQYIEKNYGHDAFVSILKRMRLLTNKKGKYNALDIINNEIEGDITDTLNKRFHISKDMLGIQIPRIYDYNN